MNKFVRKISATESDLESSRSPTPLLAEDRSAKRIKRESLDESGETEESDHSLADIYDNASQSHHIKGAEPQKTVPATEVERALPPSGTQEEAEEAYEEFKSSHAANEKAGDEKTNSMWIKGRRSIYVDAFNLALDTVLEEERQLFNEQELVVFQFWSELNYEAQYM